MELAPRRCILFSEVVMCKRLYKWIKPLLSIVVLFAAYLCLSVEALSKTNLAAGDTITPAYLAGKWLRMGGPPGGLGYDIRMRPDNPDVMFVTDGFAGVHKSTDGGKTWTPTNTGMEISSGAGAPIFCLTIDPNNYDILWVGTYLTGHFYRSIDNGETWEERDTGVRVDEDIRTVRGFTVDPNQSDIVYAGVEVNTKTFKDGRFEPRRLQPARGEVYKSADAGETWSLIWEGDNLARYIWVNPQNTNRLYVSTGIFDRDAYNSNIPEGRYGGVGILRSDDAGLTWTVLNQKNGLGGLYIPSLFMHPQNPDTLIAAVTTPTDSGGVYVTYDGGNHWQCVLPTNEMDAVEISTTDTNIWYAGKEAKIYRSDDAGKTWNGPYDIKTADRGAGIPIDLQADPRDPQSIFDNNYGGGNFVSTDGGVTWSDASRGYTGLGVTQMVIHPEDTASVYAGPYKSTDGGTTWKSVGLFTAKVLAAFKSDDGSQLHLLGGGGNGQIHRSIDAGKTWESIQVIDTQGAVVSMNAMAVAPSDPRIVYAGLSGDCAGNIFMTFSYVKPPYTGFFRSSDGGHTWEQVAGTPVKDEAILSIAVHPTDPKAVWAATGAGLYSSTDGGSSWNSFPGLNTMAMAAITNPDCLSLTAPLIEDVILDPFNPQVVYVACVPGVVFKSEDSGESWSQVAVGMDPNDPIMELVADPNRQGVLYAASNWSGVYYTTDGAKTWFKLNDGLDVIHTACLALSSDGSVLYAGTNKFGANGAGVFRLGTPSVETALQAPNLVFPANGAQEQYTTLVLRWDGVAGAVSYKVQIATDSTFSTGLIAEESVLIPEKVISGLSGQTTFYWRVAAVNDKGKEAWSSVFHFRTAFSSAIAEKIGDDVPKEFALYQNYPNPFNPTTTICFDVKEPCRVLLKVYDLTGREVAVLADGNFSAGRHEVQFGASGLPSGIYVYRIQMGDFTTARKMVKVE